MSLLHWWPLNGHTKDYGLRNWEKILTNSVFIQDGLFNQAAQSTRFYGREQALNQQSVFSCALWWKVDSQECTTRYHNAISLCIYDPALSAYGYVRFDNTTYDTQQIRAMHFHDNSNGRFTTGNNFQDNIPNPYDKWHHYVMACDGTKIQFYIDGQPAGTAPVKTGSFLTGELTAETIVGVYVNDLRIYDHCLSQLEAKELSQGLTVHYNFEERINEPTTNVFANKVLGWGNRWQEVTEYPAGITPQARVLKRTSSNNYFGSASDFFQDLSVDAWKGQYLTFSCWYYRGSATSPKIGVHLSNANYTYYTEPVSWTNRDVVGEWAYGTYTGRVKPNLTYTDPIYYVPGCGGGSDDDVFYIADPQLELKPYATPYVNGTRTPGDVFDNSGYGHDAISGSDVDFTTAVSSGTKALKLNGATVGNPNNSYIYASNAPDLKIWTVNMWMTMHTNASMGATQSLICGKSPNGAFDGYTKLTFQNGGTRMAVRCTLNDGSTYNDYLIGPGSISINVPHMYTWVSDGTTISGYVDGVLQGTATPASQYHNLFNPGSLGKAWSDGHWNPDAEIDDFKVWGSALSAADILTEYQRKAAIAQPAHFMARELVEVDGVSCTIDKKGVTRTGFVEAPENVKVFHTILQADEISEH